MTMGKEDVPGFFKDKNILKTLVAQLSYKKPLLVEKVLDTNSTWRPMYISIRLSILKTIRMDSMAWEIGVILGGLE